MLAELEQALALVPLVRSNLARPVATTLLQTDASDTGAAAVYTDAVPHRDLRWQCMRPRHVPKLEDAPSDPWCVERALAANFVAPVDPAVWRVAFRRQYAAGTRERATRPVCPFQVRSLSRAIICKKM